MLSNAAWMMGEQMIRLTAALLIGVWMARYLGPADFGRLNSAIAYAGIFAIFAKLGLDRIFVRELVEHAKDELYASRFLAVMWTMRLTGAVVAYSAAVGVQWISGWGDGWIVAIVSSQILFSVTDSIDLLFQSRVNSKPVVMARSLAFFATSGVKLVLLYFQAPLSSFVWVMLLDFAASSLALVLIYHRHHLIKMRLAFEASTSARLLQESWPEIFAGFSGLLLMRLDQVMLRELDGPEAAGIFAVAARLSEAWYFVPMALISSSFPAIVRIKTERPADYMRELQKLMTMLVGLAYLVIAIVQFLAAPAIKFLYGASYAESATILVIQIWCGLFMSLGLGSGSWIMAERKVRLNLFRNLIGASVNVVLNLILIPRYGAVGAAVATLTSLSVAYLVFDFVCRPMRPMAKIKLRSLILLRH